MLAASKYVSGLLYYFDDHGESPSIGDIVYFSLNGKTTSFDDSSFKMWTHCIPIGKVYQIWHLSGGSYIHRQFSRQEIEQLNVLA